MTTAMHTASDDVLSRITKLLRLAGNNPSEHEAQAAMVKAQEMMLGHGLTLADMAAFDDDGRVKIEATHAHYYVDTHATPYEPLSWRAYLAHYLAMSMGGKAIISAADSQYIPADKRDGKLGMVTFFAFGEESLAGVMELYRYMELQLELLSAKATKNRQPDTDIYDPETKTIKRVRRNGDAWRRAWLAGAVTRLGKRLDDQYKQIEAQGNGTALVLLKDVIDEKVYEVFGSTSYCSSRKANYNQAAFNAGQAAANSMDIGAAKLGGTVPVGLPA